MRKFRGFTVRNIPRNKNNMGAHDTFAADLICAWGRQFYAPIGEDRSVCKFKVIKANAVDPAANNVVYTVIQDISHKTRQTFWYFHTAKSSLKPGQIITSGTKVCVSAKNGTVTGPHLHLEVRTASGGRINPKDVLSIMKGGVNGILMGFPK